MLSLGSVDHPKVNGQVLVMDGRLVEASPGPSRSFVIHLSTSFLVTNYRKLALVIWLTYLDLLDNPYKIFHTYYNNYS